ncbi:MAG: hypothetical protein AAF847_09950 [Bacteroidota bacterium]
MQTKISTIYLFLLLLFAACQTDNTKASEPTEDRLERRDLIGIWEQTSLKVTFNQTMGIPDSQRVFEVQEENWEETLSVKPVRSYFLADSTYRQDFIALNGDVYDSQRGLWNLIGDTLMLISPNASYTYEITVEANGTSRYVGILDWDGDGLEDDEYRATQRLVSRNTEL